MNIKLFTLISVITLVVLSGCASTNPIINEKPSDHPHLNPYTKNAGDYYVQGFVDRRNSEFVVRVLDRYEQPEWVVVPSIKSEIKHADGRVENVWIDAPDYADSLFDERATVNPTYQ